MTSFDKDDVLVRPDHFDGTVVIKPATGPDDPRASNAGRALMRFVNGKTQGERLLRRSDFSPVDLKSYLTNIMILDLKYDAGGQPVDGIVRLMGSDLSSFYGEFTGRSVMDHPSESGQRLLIVADLVCKTKSMVIGNAEQGMPNQPLRKIVTLTVPIADDGMHINQLLILVQPYSSDIGVA